MRDEGKFRSISAHTHPKKKCCISGYNTRWKYLLTQVASYSFLEQVGVRGQMSDVRCQAMSDRLINSPHPYVSPSPVPSSLTKI
jgi:hypothetical protein